MKDEIVKAEIWWCLFTVTSHLSLNSAGKATRIFPKMFHDSAIARQMQLGRTKIGYNILFGLAPYFHQLVFRDVSDAEVFVLFFYVSLNKYAQQQQIDLAVRFWDSVKNEVTRRFFTSAFLGHSTADDMLKALISSLKERLKGKMIQLSIVGPNVNLKLVKDLEAYLKEVKDEREPMFILMGSCGPHVVNNAFKSRFADKKSGWHVISSL